MRLRNKIPEIFSRIEKFRKIQEPILAELGLKEALNELENVIGGAESSFERAERGLNTTKKKLVSLLNELFQSMDDYDAAIDGARIVMKDLESAGMKDNPMMNTAEDIDESSIKGKGILNDIAMAIKKIT